MDEHGSLDRGRVIFTLYRTPGATYRHALDVVCAVRAGGSLTFELADGARWQDGCCRDDDVGGPACCGVDEPPERDAGPPPERPDAGYPGQEADCPLLRSREFGDEPALLDVRRGDPRRLTVHVDGVPDPARLAYAQLSLVLHDADHPNEEGEVFVNGHGALPLPADGAWSDVSADATLPIPTGWLMPGANRVEFGAGSRERTYYSVSRVGLTVSGDPCEPPEAPDLGPPPQPDLGPQPEPDLGPQPEPDLGPQPRTDLGGPTDAGRDSQPGDLAPEPVDTGADAGSLGAPRTDGAPPTGGSDVLAGGCSLSRQWAGANAEQLGLLLALVGLVVRWRGRRRRGQAAAR